MTPRDAAKFVSETHRHAHDERRRYETRFLLGAIGVMILCVGAVLQHPPTLAMRYFMAGGLVLLAGVAGAYLHRIHRASIVNLAFAEEAERILVRASGMTTMDDFLARPRRDLNRVNYSWWFQCVVLLLTGVFAAVIVLSAPASGTTPTSPGSSPQP